MNCHELVFVIYCCYVILLFVISVTLYNYKVSFKIKILKINNKQDIYSFD